MFSSMVCLSIHFFLDTKRKVTDSFSFHHLFITPLAKEIMFSVALACLFVCLSVCLQATLLKKL